VAIAANAVLAQSAATVPSQSSSYDRLESLSSLLVPRAVFLGERPLSQRELLRSIAVLNRALDGARVGALTREWAKSELSTLSAAANTADKRSGFAWSTTQEIWASKAQTDRFTSNGLGSIDAVTNPFEMGRRGVPVGDGLGASVIVTALTSVGSQVAFVVEPRFTTVRRAEVRDEFELQRWYARGVVRNVAFQVGRDDRRWGQSPIGSLFISANAEGFPAISIGTDTAITLPWLFHLIGPARFTLFLADLGADQNPPHARLAGWQGTFQPVPRIEIGIDVLTQTGGNGGPPARFIVRFVDLFPLIDALAPQRKDIQVSNKVAGGHLRLRVPELSNVDFYYELQLDDFDGRRLRSSFVDDGAHLLGARLPVLTERGLFVVRAEWHHSALRLYEHTQFPSGVTYRDKIIGEPLGPHASSAHVALEWHPSPPNGISLLASDERRDPSQYSSTVSGAFDRGFRFIRLTDDPSFRRRRALLTIVPSAFQGTARLTLGYNRAWRTDGPARNEWLAGLSVGTTTPRMF
jgi:hypothetical protein